MPIPLRETLQHRKLNPNSRWYSGVGIATDAAARLYDGYAEVRADYDGPKLSRQSKVFTIGSCFAREIENALRRLGGNIISLDPSELDRPCFGGFREGFLHRFTPLAIRHEFLAAFGELPGWNDATSLIIRTPQGFDDLNYWSAPDADASAEAVASRRMAGQNLVRRAREADVIVVTLGYTETWRQIASGFDLNWFSPALARTANEYEFSVMSYDQVLAALEDTRAALERNHATGQFRMVVTVSPVPLGVTFSQDDIIVANARSKSTLRAAAGASCERHPHAHYFPSYEIATNTAHHLAWQEDRIHVLPGLVEHIVRTFLSAYYEDGAFQGDVALSAGEPNSAPRAYSWQR